MSGTHTYGPIAFTNDIPFSYPQFASPATEYLHSITFVVTNCVLDQDLIADNDSTNSVVLDTSYGQSFHLVKAGNFWISGIYGLVFSVNDHLSGTFAGVNDGDLRFVRGGGDDELMFHFAHSNINRQTVVTYGSVLAQHTGSGSNDVTIGRYVTSFIGPSVDLDVFHTNETYSGDVYIQYHFETTPLTPAIAGASVSNGVFRLDIENLSVASSNVIQRCFDLTSNTWTNVHEFVGHDWRTTWVEELSNGWLSVFYRVISK